MFREKTSNRRDFKSGLNAEEQRTKRAELAVSLRKTDREEQLARRRRNRGADDEDAATPSENTDQDLANLPTFVNNLSDPSPEVVLEAAKKIRQLLSLERNPPINAVIQYGGVAKLMNLLSCPHNNIVFEAAWAVTNIASGTSENTAAVVDANAIPLFINLLDSSHDEVRDQAVWALGNISGESSRYRDQVLAHDAMPKLLQLAHSHVKLCMLRNIAWTLSNFCRGKNPQPDFNIVSSALPTLYNMIHFDDDDVIADAAWALSYLSDDVGGDGFPENHKIQVVSDAGVVSRLVQLLQHSNHHVKTPALRAVGNLVTGNHLQTQNVLNLNVLPALLSLLNSPRRSIRKEACWTISNITAGTVDQVKMVIHANIFHMMLSMIESADLSVKKEIAWTISNALAQVMDHEIMNFLVSVGVIPQLANLLRHADNQLQLIVIDSTEHLLNFGENTAEHGENRMKTLIEQAGIMDEFEKIQQNGSDEAYKKTYDIMIKYYPNVEEKVVDGPTVDAQGNFVLGGDSTNETFNL